MPKGLQGQKRSADVIGNAVCVTEIATGPRGEEPETERQIGYLVRLAFEKKDEANDLEDRAISEFETSRYG